jgi:serine/threonine-protein kinase
MPHHLLLTALALLLATSALAQDWRVYSNPRFGTRAEVPRDWTMGPAPENYYGRVFTAPDGSAHLTVYGSLHVLDSIDEAMNIHGTPKVSETVTAKQRGKRSITVAGTRENRIFYRKAILSCRDQIWNGVAIDYPAADKHRFDALVTHVATSLRGGQGWQVKGCR